MSMPKTRVPPRVFSDRQYLSFEMSSLLYSNSYPFAIVGSYNPNADMEGDGHDYESATIDFFYRSGAYTGNFTQRMNIRDLDKNGEIIFLSRLFEEKEFNEMIKTIDAALKKS